MSDDDYTAKQYVAGPSTSDSGGGWAVRDAFDGGRIVKFYRRNRRYPYLDTHIWKAKIVAWYYNSMWSGENKLR